MIGAKYGRYTVLERAARSGYVHCRCACGTEKVVALSSLRLGKSKSCGCLRREVLAAAHTTHGAAGNRDGVERTKEYRAWSAMKNRCFNTQGPGYEDYGGRGISVYPLWVNSFAAFYAHIGPAPSPRHSIDRIDVNGNYEPGNVRWATPKQQAYNRRNNKKYSLGRRRYTLLQLELLSGIKQSTLRARLKHGASVAQAINTPLRKY